MTKNDELFETARKAIMVLFSDTSVTKEECQRNLRAIQDEIDLLLESLEE